MKILLMISGGLVGAGVFLGAQFWAAALKQNRILGQEKDRVEAELQEANGRVEAIEREGAAMEEEVKATLGRVAELERQLVEAKTKERVESEAPSPVLALRKVRVYLGRESLGRAWMVPSQVARDPETGKVTYEPVLVLDEGLRKSFTVTNIVEREVFRTATINNTYLPAERAYYPVYYPAILPAHRRPRGVDRPPDRPRTPAFPIQAPARGNSPWSSVFVAPGK